MKKITIIILLFLSSKAMTQDLVYTQTFGSPMYVNPAFTGNLAKTSFYLNARQQWPTLSGSYVASSFAANHRLDNINSGIGLIVLQEDQGEARFSTTRLSGIYSYILHINKEWSISAAMQSTYMNSRYKEATFRFGDQINDDFSVSETTQEQLNFKSKSNVDLSSGFIIFNGNAWFGGSAHHLTEPKNFIDNSTSLNRKFSIHGGYQINIESPSLSEVLVISPSVNINYQMPFTRTGMNFIATYYFFSIGSGIANLSSSTADKNILNSFILLGYSDEHFKVGYSYDFTISGAVGFGGAHELTLGILLNYDNNSDPNPLKHKKIRKVSCPKF